MKYGTCVLAAVLTVLIASVVSRADIIDFDTPSDRGSRIDPSLISGKWADNPDDCKPGPIEPGDSQEEIGCIYALMNTYADPPIHIVAELCYAEDTFADQGLIKSIRPIDKNTIRVKVGTHWIESDETISTYKRCPSE